MGKFYENDAELSKYKAAYEYRDRILQDTVSYINDAFGSLQEFASSYKYLGINYDAENKGYWVREWAPNATQVFVVGDFNGWNSNSHPLHRIDFGVWEVFLSDEEYHTSLVPFSKLKLRICFPHGEHYKIPAYIKRAVQNEDHNFDGQLIPPSNFHWTDDSFEVDDTQPLLIYECHIGMGGEEAKVSSYTEFTENILPRIKDLGYTAIQIMAIQEHPYYGSFGYQVSNFFAPSSRFGTPDELRNLINTAHQMGIAVILDVVHSHAVKNEQEGLVNFDGTDLYFNGEHPDWDSKLFDYGRIEVKKFLLSNLLYWMEEFHFDGFRFDGVTSMLYHHFGHIAFTDYDAYFSGTNEEAILYLRLANILIKQQSKKKISICEDMSGMPGACRPISESGLGFDYRLAMGIPDYWMDTLEFVSDEHLHLGNMFWRLTDRRAGEKNIGYVESHDQALVGDKTVAFWLMDKEMYTGMSVLTENLVIDRGIALHKMIRFITLCLGGEGYMNFMGNEFGHPEWVDFPREGNNWSYQYARRQWSLPDTDHLKYKYLQAFDKAMIHFVKKYPFILTSHEYKIHEDNAQKILAFTYDNLVFVFNFHWDSFEAYPIQMPTAFAGKIIFSSDDNDFGGYNRLDKNITYQTDTHHQIQLYLPSRSCFVLLGKR